MRRDRTLARQWTTSSTFSRVSASPRRSGSAPSCPRCSSERSPPANLGVDFDGTDFSFLEQRRVPARDRGRSSPSSASSTAAARRHERATARSLRCWQLRSCSARCWPAGSIADAQRHLVAGVPIGVAAASLGFVAARSLFGRVRARLDADAAERAAALRRGRRPCSPPGSRSCSRRWPSSSSRRSPGCSSAGAAARARSTPGCGSCGEEARPRRHRRDEARDARAGGRDGPRADAAAADRARALRRRVRRRVPVGDAGLRGLDRHRHRPGRARDPGDELVAPRRGALHRVRHELRRLARVRHPPVAHRHDLQHEPRAPLARTSRRCSSASTTPTSAPPARPT